MLAWVVTLVLGGGGLLLGYDDFAMLVVAMPPATLVVVWIWRRLGVALHERPATF